MIALSLRHVPESRSVAAGHVDGLGAMVATLGLGGIVSGFTASVSLGWRHPLVLGCLIGGLACFLMFFFVEARVASPMVPVELFASCSFLGANLLTFFLYAALGIFFFLFPLNLIQVEGYSATATGAAALPLIMLMFFLSRWSGGLVARYGARKPLVIGPLVAAFGFFLFALPSVGGGYWSTFFPAFVVLGLGMAVSVAPLTTVVMSSVSQDRVGAASGINNAVARVAGVLAIAVFGIVIVKAFSSHLNQSLANLTIPPSILQAIQSNEIKLAGLPLPAGLNAGMATEIRSAVSQAFVFGFRIIMLICTGLSIISAATAWLTIPAKLKH